MATTWFCGNCMTSFNSFMKDLEGWEYGRLCAELEDPDAKSCSSQCSDIQNEHCKQHTLDPSACQLDAPQVLTSLCQFIDASDVNPDKGELQRRDLKSPPTDDPTSEEPTRTRAPPKITNASPTHKILTLTELTDVPSTRSTTETVPTTTTNSPIPTTFNTLASSSTSMESSTTVISASPLPSLTTPVALNLSTGSIVGIAIGAALLCGVLWLVIRCCFKHGGKLDAAKDGLHTETLVPLEFVAVPEKYGNTVSELDSRVAANPPRPVQEGIHELGGEPVVAPRSEDTETPKIVATVSEGIRPREQAETVAANGAGGERVQGLPEMVIPDHTKGQRGLAKS
ncbi:hypothetical protein N8T08_010010 [Aspergillus melleus]|uniref:Uncharacterized protein n=1 Tax=Aspergillus melleus TaxID=138277 RepID=A0ACC3AT33_9EURO|nr:hypothetical protein N8T08_010010 [Aspergillus melleus]